MENKRILALDIGDVWIGTAHTDFSKTFVHPNETWKRIDLIKNLENYFKLNQIEIIVVGLPITMKGKESAQTKKTLETCELIKKSFPEIIIETFDERLSSSFAKNIQFLNKTKNKLKEHSIAAAIILENYLNKIKQNK